MGAWVGVWQVCAAPAALMSKKLFEQLQFWDLNPSQYLVPFYFLGDAGCKEVSRMRLKQRPGRTTAAWLQDSARQGRQDTFETRLVVMPDFQGIGIGPRFSDTVGTIMLSPTSASCA